MASMAMRQLQMALDGCLNDARDAATRHGLNVPKVLLVLRDPAEPTKIVCVGNDDPAECFAVLREHASVETPPLTPHDALKTALGF